MKNRTEEYWALVGELSQTPQELEGSVERARKRAKRAAPLRRLAAPAASLAGLAAAFVLLVNTFPTFALACSGVPVLRELTAAVAFSPSLSAAVAHDYVQYIGQSQTVDGVTAKIEYAIVDKHQAVFFYSTEGGRFWTSPKLLTQDGEPIGGYAVSHNYMEGYEGMENMTLSFTGGENGLPERFTMELYFLPKPSREYAEAVAPSSTLENAPEALDQDEPIRFTFDITLDPARIDQGRTVEVGKWLELDGQRILMDRLELFPTRTILYLGEDSANTAWLKSLKFSFVDEKGRVYDDIDGSLSASGEEDSKSYLTYYFQSFYYDPPKALTLHISKARWLDKDASRVQIDLAAGTCSGLPDGVELQRVTRNGDDVEVRFVEPLWFKEISQLFSHTYWDPEGGEHSFNRWSGGSEFNADDEEIGLNETAYLEDYPWDTVEVELSYTGVSEYDPEVRVELF